MIDSLYRRTFVLEIKVKEFVLQKDRNKIHFFYHPLFQLKKERYE